MQRRTFLAMCCAAAAPTAISSALGQTSEALSRVDLSQLRAGGDIGFTPAARALAGQPVIVSGYLIRHAKAGAGFQVLAASPNVPCPHCFPEFPLPPDSILAYLREEATLPNGVLIEVVGVLDLGAKRDTWTGVISFARLLDATLYLS